MGMIIKKAKPMHVEKVNVVADVSRQSFKRCLSLRQSHLRIKYFTRAKFSSLYKNIENQ